MITNSSVEQVGTTVLAAAGRITPDQAAPKQSAPAQAGGKDVAASSVGDKAADAAAKTASKPSDEQASRMAEQLERVLNELQGTKLEFRVEKMHRGDSLCFAVVDSKTGEVLREFPPEAVVQAAEDEAGGKKAGLLVDEQA